MVNLGGGLYKVRTPQSGKGKSGGFRTIIVYKETDKDKGINMRDQIKKAIGDTLQNIVKQGIKTSFTEKELKGLGVEIPEVEISAKDIQKIRERIKISQSVFAKILNVSSSSVRQWEQGKRTPTGSTKILLELLKRDPNILNFRIGSSGWEKQA